MDMPRSEVRDLRFDQFSVTKHLEHASAQARARDLVQAHGITIVVPPAEDLDAKRREMLAHQEQVAKLSNIAPEMVSALSDALAAG